MQKTCFCFSTSITRTYQRTGGVCNRNNLSLKSVIRIIPSSSSSRPIVWDNKNYGCSSRSRNSRSRKPIIIIGSRLPTRTSESSGCTREGKIPVGNCFQQKVKVQRVGLSPFNNFIMSVPTGGIPVHHHAHAGGGGTASSFSTSTFCLSPPLMMSSSPGTTTLLTPTSSMYNLSGESSDDIVALSSGFDRRKTLRRRLSTAAETPPIGPGSGGAGAGSGTGGPDDSSESTSTPTRRIGLGIQRRKDSITEDPEAEIAVPNLDQLSLEADDEKRHVVSDVLRQLETIIGYAGRNVSQMILEKAVKELCTAYDDLEDSDKYNFFNTLATKYYVDQSTVSRLAKAISECTDPNSLISLQDKLRSALVPKYQWLFSQIGRLEGGVKFLVDFRTDLSELTPKFSDPTSSSSSSVHLKTMNTSLKELISAWFGVGFLNLERVTWQSPCDMLQKITEYEAVHPMRNWTDLKRRVGNYRRCFVYTHPSMKGEPVVVLHTALTDHIPTNIGSIVANSRMRMMSVDSNADLGVSTGVEDSRNITTAIFYSITSTQKGLAGIELGNYLIKRVVRELQREFPKIHNFSSLSPIPGYRTWLINELKSYENYNNKGAGGLLNSGEIELLGKLVGEGSEGEVLKKLQYLISQNDWVGEEELCDGLENFMMRQCAKYLVLVKRRGFAMNSVAHFHLKNGAIIWRLNWKANLKPRGLTESCGIMVNYRYFLDDCESNSQNYMEKQEIKISDSVQHLIKLVGGGSKMSKI